jgi:hypothetical protein
MPKLSDSYSVVRTAQEHRFILMIPKRFVGVWDKKVYNGMLAYDRTPELANGRS